MEISKADWKLFRERVPEWQEHYMEQLVKGYINLLSSPGNASDHFWELEKRIKRDKKHPGVILEMNKSDAIWDIALFQVVFNVLYVLHTVICSVSITCSKSISPHQLNLY